MINVVLLGAGNVGTNLYAALKSSKTVQVVQVYNRTALKGPMKGCKEFTKDLNSLKEADVYIIAVPDDAIPQLSAKIPFKNKLVVHTAGGVDMKELDEKNYRGVFYPVQTFSKEKKVPFKTIPICVEAEREEDFKLLYEVANSISQKVCYINSEQRKSLHLAAVFANNFTNHLYQIAHEICKENMVSFEILRPLIEETAHKLSDMPAKMAQTGPARRNDKRTIKKHLQLLKTKTHKDLYELFTKSILETYGRKKL